MAKVDEMGVTRHALDEWDLGHAYWIMEAFIADLTLEEYKAHEVALKEVLTLIHQRMNNN